MGLDSRHRLAALLGATSGRANFSAKRTAAPGDLHIDVAGVGPLEIPVSSAQARQLCAIARPARYGLGERTLTDSRIRHTWEVPKSRVRIDQRRWNRTLLPILDGLRADLGLPRGCRLKAQLHSVLVYSPGQFFVPHQDSEKSDDMVGTLTVTLPGNARGGTLVVDHGDTRATYRSSDKRLSFVAFYADCRHEVRRVTSGYRVALTYNLLLTGDPVDGWAPEPETVAGLAACLEEHFTEQNRLVYLLDHEYTASGMSWSRLKGVDAARFAALVAAARAGDCEIVLALADLHESWSAEAPYDGRGYWRDEGGEEDGEYELVELIESSIDLNRWVDRSGAPAQAVASAVSDDEVCATTPTARLTPYDSQYEGYMGNYGNTMDRWYRRGAVVLWPRRLDFTVRAEASASWALDYLTGLLGDGEQARARELAESLTHSWARTVRGAASGGSEAPGAGFGQALAIAHGLDDPGLAAMLLRPFRMELLTPADAPALAALSEQHGEGWLGELLGEWDPKPYDRYRPAQDRQAWLSALPELCLALTRSAGSGVARLLLAASWRWLAESIRQARAISHPAHRALALDELPTSIAGLLAGAAVSEEPAITATAISFLCDRDDVLLRCVVNALRVLAEAAPQTRAGSGFDALAGHARARVEARLAQPLRDPGDWSISTPGGCSCELCRRFDTFLADPEARRLEWPLAEQKRRHVHDRINRHDLPVQHRTKRVGRPYTLVLTKTQALFEREAQERHQDEADLRWLRELPA